MSYCRFSESDAYIYDDVRYGLICCFCSLASAEEASGKFLYDDDHQTTTYIANDFIAGRDYNSMISHVADHRAAGDYIPEHVDERLAHERDEAVNES
jgi:hypothetical protein